MSIRSDHKALLFLGAIAVLGATVRVARAVTAPVPGAQPALDHQMQAADSAKRSLSGKRADRDHRPVQSRPAGGRGARAAVPQAGQSAALGSSHRDYKGRLDLDAASAAEVESLPGLGPSLAKRIVADRMKNGAFRELTALRRVKGVSVKLLTSLDSLVSFSGVYKTPQSSDTVLAEKPRRKAR